MCVRVFVWVACTATAPVWRKWFFSKISQLQLDGWSGVHSAARRSVRWNPIDDVAKVPSGRATDSVSLFCYVCMCLCLCVCVCAFCAIVYCCLIIFFALSRVCCFFFHIHFRTYCERVWCLHTHVCVPVRVRVCVYDIRKQRSSFAFSSLLSFCFQCVKCRTR